MLGHLNVNITFAVQMPQGLGIPSLPPSLPHAGLPTLQGLGASPMMGMGISQAAAASQMAANMAAAARMQAAMAQTGCVILVSNLDEEVCSYPLFFLLDVVLFLLIEP